MRAHRREVDHIEADAVFPDHLQLWKTPQYGMIDDLECRDRLVVALQKLNQRVAGKLPAGIVERHLRISGQQLRSQHRIA